MSCCGRCIARAAQQATDREANLITLQGSKRSICPLVEVVVRIGSGVADELVHRAVDCVATRLHYQIDLAAVEASKLSSQRAGLDPKLLHAIDGRSVDDKAWPSRVGGLEAIMQSNNGVGQSGLASPEPLQTIRKVATGPLRGRSL